MHNNNSSSGSRFQLIGISGTRSASCTSSPIATDLSVLEEASLGKLLASRLDECREYLERMIVRVRDRTSRVLVTGDVNGGKSTLINAFLSYTPPILPMDQQPCTQAFCEVVPLLGSSTQPTVNAIPDYDKYDQCNGSTFDLMSMSRMQSTVQEEDAPYQWYRILLPIRPDNILLCNDLVQVSLIDSPGLNSDLFKTMNLFARQEEIDVIVFVVNAANHLTLSAREFLETAGRDKAYIFIVVNKFDDIRNKDKCRRIIMQQIAEVLPSTAAEASELVHFVSAKNELSRAAGKSGSSDSIPVLPIADADLDQQSADFARLQASLADFILSKRTKSKLLPAKTFLLNLLSDLQILLQHNERCCQEELTTIRRDIDLLTPCYEELVKREAPLRQDLLHGVTDASNLIYSRSSQVFCSFEIKIKDVVSKAPWQGLFSIWAWRKRILGMIEQEAGGCLSEAQRAATDTMRTSLDYLHHTALSHAASVYGKDSSSGMPLPLQQPHIVLEINALNKLPRWELFDVSLFSMPSVIKVLVTGCLAGSSVFLASSMSLSVSAYLLQNVAAKRLPLLIVGGVLSASSLLVLFGDFEGMARMRLIRLLLSHYGDPSWKHRHCHAIESACHQQLMAVSGGLLQRFQEALASQRRLRAEKDLQRAQLSTRLEQVIGQHRRITLLHESVNGLVL